MQKLKNIVREFSRLIFDWSEIRNNFHDKVPTEDEVRDTIIWRNFEGYCYVPNLPNKCYSAFKSSIPEEEVNKAINEAKKGKRLWDRLESRLSEIRQRLKDPAFKYLPEIFTSEYCQKTENPGDVLCFISEIESEFKKEKFYLLYTPNYETAFKDFLLNKLKDMGDRCCSELEDTTLQKLSRAEAGKGEGKDTTNTLKLVVEDKKVFTGKEKNILNRGISFGGIPYTLPKTPFKFLYALAKARKTGMQGVTSDIFYGITKGGTEKSISHHLRTIKDRIPPLLPLIKPPSSFGHNLDLPPEAIEIVGELKDVDIALRLPK